LAIKNKLLVLAFETLKEFYFEVWLWIGVWHLSMLY